MNHALKVLSIAVFFGLGGCAIVPYGPIVPSCGGYPCGNGVYLAPGGPAVYVAPAPVYYYPIPQYYPYGVGINLHFGGGRYYGGHRR